jgi:CBS domain containing-hemolysin-like protein
MIGTLLLFVVLLVLSGFFSGSEIACFSVSQARARAMAEEERPGAAALVALKSTPDRLLITILIGNNVVNIGAASLATYIATRAVGSAGVGLATGVVTLLVLFFGEILPKSFFSAHADRAALLAAPVLQGLSKALFFLVTPLAALTRRMVPRGSRRGGQRVSEGEIRKLTQMGHVSGTIEEHERELIERTFLLDTTRAWEVMVPRVDVFAWPDDRTLAEIADELAEVPYSRIPVYDESLDDVTGILYVRDAYRALVDGRSDVPLAELAREPFFVPETLTLIEVLGQFQAQRVHMGLVVDEYGGTDGLVTLEDVLEELVGDIVDEVDVPEERFIPVGRHEALVDGSTDLRRINEYFDTSLPGVEHRSLNGYLLEELGRVPQPGEVIERGEVRVEVLGANDTQVTRARLTHHQTAAAPPGGSPAPPAGQQRAGGPGSGPRPAAGREGSDGATEPRPPGEDDAGPGADGSAAPGRTSGSDEASGGAPRRSDVGVDDG